MKSVTIEDLLNYRYIENLQYNPSGTAAAYQLVRADEKKNTYHRDIMLVENNQIRQLTSTIDATIVSWYDDDTLLLSRNTEETETGTTDIYRIHIYGGEAIKWLTLPFDLNRLKVMDEHTFIATASINMHEPDVYCIKEDERKKYFEDKKKESENYQVVDEIPYWFNGAHFINGNRTALFLIHTEPFTVNRITEPAFDVSDFIIHGTDVIYTGYKRKARELLFNQLYQWNEKDGIQVLYEPMDYSISSPFFLHENLFVQASDMKEYGVNETAAIYEVKDGKLNYILKPEVSLYNSIALDTTLGGNAGKRTDNDIFYTLATEDYKTVIYAYNETFHKKVISIEGYTISGFDIRNSQLLFVAETKNHIQEIYSLNTDTDELHCLSHHNDEVMSERYIAKPKKFTYQSEGETLNGWVLLPKDYDENKKYPAVFDIHGGPRAAYSEAFFHEMQVWASEGYFVFYTNIRGSDGRGDAFADIRGLYGSVDYKNLMDFTDEVLKRYPAIDNKKICETGGSYGGFMTNWIIGHTDRFCCACSQRSIANWISKSFMSDIGPYFNPDQCGAESPFDFEPLWAHSPLKYAKNAKTPTLFIHSDQDHRCPLPEGMQMMQALVMNGVETRMCIFHGENHELSRSGKPQHRIRRLTEITDWFNKHTR